MRNLYPKGPVPSDIPLARVEVWHHESGLMATHNMPCAACSKAHAVLRTDKGVFGTCWGCRKKGYHLVKVNRFVAWWLRFIGAMTL